MRYFIRTMFLTSKKPMAYFACHILGIFKGKRDFGPTLPVWLVENLRFLKSTKILDQHFYPNPSFNTFQNLGLFHKNLDGKSPCPVLFVTILGLLKSTKISGLHRIVILGLARVKILGFFIRTIFLTPKTQGLLLLAKILGFLKSAKILGPHCDKIPGLTPVDILGYFLRTRCLTPKTHCLCGLSKSWGFKEYKDIGPTWYPNQSFIPVNFCFLFFVLFCFVLFCFALLCFALLCFALLCFALLCFVLFCLFVFFCWLFHNYVFEAKNSWPIFVFVKILGFSKNGEILGLHCIKISGKRPVKILAYFIRTMFFDAKNP